MKNSAPAYEALRVYCESIPIVDTHDHATKLGPAYSDPIQVIIGEYLVTDLASATSETESQTLLDHTIPWLERWPILEKAWSRTQHTGFAQVTRRVLQKFYDRTDVTLETMYHIADNLPDYSDVTAFEAILDEAKIVVRLEDIWPDVHDVVNGRYQLPVPRSRLVIPLPGYHRARSFMEFQNLVAPVGHHVTTLDAYVDACFEIFAAFKAFGAVAFKDQSAYFRSLSYGNPTHAEAEKVFNWLMADATRSAGYPDELKPLDDYLFHAFLRMAYELDLPVQLHTGHLAGLYGDITKANAAQLADLFLLHRDVRFDLFHANWPYGAEVLYLVKNFPNVRLNFCWANVIDPLYCQNLYKQAVSAVPHSKIHAYGSDYGGYGYYPGGGYPDRAWAHAQITRDNIAIALSDLVEIDYITIDEAQVIAQAWLYDNPKTFYRLDNL